MLLTLKWDEARGALPLESIWEVVRLGEDGDEALRSVPQMRVSLAGMLMRRSYAVPVFDPRRWKGFFEHVPDAQGQYAVLLQTEDSLDGLLAEEVGILSAFERLTDFAQAETRNATGLGKRFVDSAVRGERAVWALLSVSRLARAMHGELDPPSKENP
jgi:chemotaxis signal transduction protein